MQPDKKRQGVAAAPKVNLAAAKIIIAAARENLTVTVSPGIKWREDKAEVAHCSEKTCP